MNDYEKMLREELFNVKMELQRFYRLPDFENDKEYQELYNRKEQIKRELRKSLLESKLNERKVKEL